MDDARQQCNASHRSTIIGISPSERPRLYSLGQIFDLTTYPSNQTKHIKNNFAKTSYSIDSVSFLFQYSKYPSITDVDTITITIIGGIDQTNNFNKYYTIYQNEDNFNAFQQSTVGYNINTNTVDIDSLNPPIFYSVDIPLTESLEELVLPYRSYYVGDVPQLQNITTENIGVFITYKSGKANRTIADDTGSELNLFYFLCIPDPNDYSYGSQNALTHTNTSLCATKLSLDENSWFHNKYSSTLILENSGGSYLRPAIGVHLTAAPTNVEEFENTPSISIFPNPANEYIIISGVNVAEANVYNLQGQLLLQEKASQDINIEKLPSGLYILRIVNENGGTSTVKFNKM